MIGNNELHLNQATMRTVVQHWLDTVFLKEGQERPLVQRVVEVNERGAQAFKVELAMPEDIQP